MSGAGAITLRSPPYDEPASVEMVKNGSGVTMEFTGPLSAAGIGRLWTPVMRAAQACKGELTADLHGVTNCDTTGVVMLLRAEAAHGGKLTIKGETEQLDSLMKRVRAVPNSTAAPFVPADWTYLSVLRDILRWAADGIAFAGEATLAVLHLPVRRRMFRWEDFWRTADLAGVRAIPLILLMGFLIGLILAFQSAIPLRTYGADLLVAYLVTTSLVRELAPLLAAVILSGRTGSAFAAEIGTMKVNEELDALATMGLDIMTMQVLPRMLAAMLVMPVLSILMILAGLAGMGAVMVLLGFSPSAILAQVRISAHPLDLAGGLFKSICFGAAVAAIGCRAGLATGVGPRAVGLAATSAVVGGIVVTIVLDGGFALAFYRLGI